MKKKENIPEKFNSLSDAALYFGIAKPLHPLISLIDSATHKVIVDQLAHSHLLNFYKIAYRPKVNGKFKYGQDYYDFDEGGLLFTAPGQLMGCHTDESNEGDYALYTLLIHPDFLWNYPLAKKIKQYGFFSYSAKEALHLSDREKDVTISIFKIIEEELNSRIDDFSQDVIISQVELLLNYANRFYKRQFITRKAVSNGLLQKMEVILTEYFKDEKALSQGIPTVQYLSDQLKISPSYLSDMLRSLTGQNGRQHIQNKLIELAKQKLSATNLSVSEVAYDLGFEHSQSFSKLFKAKTDLSPLEFRRSFS